MEATEWSSQNRGQGVSHSSVKCAPPRLSWHQLLKPVKGRRKTEQATFVLGWGGHSIPRLSPPCLKDCTHSGVRRKPFHRPFPSQFDFPKT